MPLYTNRLGDNVYPGAGRSDDGPALYDSRRSNSWLVKSAAWLQPAVRLGGTLAHVVELAGECGQAKSKPTTGRASRAGPMLQLLRRRVACTGHQRHWCC